MSLNRRCGCGCKGDDRQLREMGFDKSKIGVSLSEIMAPF